MQNKKLLSIGILFLIILGVAIFSAVGTYYYFLPRVYRSNLPEEQLKKSQSADVSTEAEENVIAQKEGIQGDSKEIAEWKTYTDSTFGYSFSYPSEWIVNPESKTITSPQKAKNNFNVLMHFLAEKTNLPISEWLKGKLMPGGMCCSLDYTLEKTTIHNTLWYIIHPSHDAYTGIVTTRNGINYYLYSDQNQYADGGSYYYNKDDEIFMRDIHTIDQIFSTVILLP